MAWGLKETANRCPECGEPLVDTVLDWDSELPKDDLKAARRHSREADLVVCLGTSLRIEPVCTLPFLNMKDNKKKVVICNLQRTPMDKRAHMVLRGDVDRIMRIVMDQLGIPVPPFDPPAKLYVAHSISTRSFDRSRHLEIVVTSDGLEYVAVLCCFALFRFVCVLSVIRSPFHLLGLRGSSA